MYRRGLLALVLLLCGFSFTGCASFRSGPRGRGGPEAKPATIVLNDDGVASPEPTRLSRPLELLPGQDLLLENRTRARYLDITFFLHGAFESGSSAAAIQGRLGPGRESFEVVRVAPTLCEVTVLMAPGEGNLSIPHELFEADTASVTPFSTLTVGTDPRTARGPEPEYKPARNQFGYVTLLSKTASLLEVPLDNTGISDWDFLNPRSPRTLPSSAAVEQMRKAPDLPPPFQPAGPRDLEPRRQRIVDKLSASLGSIHESITAYHKIPFRQELEKAQEELLGLASAPGNPTVQARCDFTPPPDQEHTLTTLNEAARLICESASWGLTHLTESTADAVTTLTESHLEAIDSVTRVIAALEEKIPQAENEHQAEQAGEILKDIGTSIEASHKLIENLDDSSGGTGRALSSLIARQAVADLAKSAAATRKLTDAVLQDIKRERLQPRRLRFFNYTPDRRFVITFAIDKGRLLQGAPASCPPDEYDLTDFEAKQRSENRQIACIEDRIYAHTVNLSAKGDAVAVSFSVDPNSPAYIDAWLLSKAGKSIVPFDVSFFDQTEVPANSRGYVALKEINLKDPSDQPDDKLTVNLVTGVTAKGEPCLGNLNDCKDKASPQKPFDGESRKHVEASGQLDVRQELGNRANGKLSLLYRKGDFGKDDAGPKLSQYQVNAFGSNNTILTLGRFAFAQPSNQIAISEDKRDGVRLSFHSYGLSYLLKRESDDGTPDFHDNDHDELIFQGSRPVPGSRFLRRFEFIVLRGEDRCKPSANHAQTGNGDCAVREVKAPDPTNPGSQISTFVPVDFPHTYTTVGTELFFTLQKRRNPLTGSLALYGSRKSSEQTLFDRNPDVRDGRGETALLTVGRAFGFASEGPLKLKPLKIVTALVGWGSGDDPKTARDEGYVGETAAFAPDTIFLSSLAGNIDTGGQGSLGKSLSNKWYLGLQYTDRSTSLLGWIAQFLHVSRGDIVSESTTISLHSYLLHEPVFGRRYPGTELDLEFRMEQPQGVKWRLLGGYFKPGGAVEPVIGKNAWSFALGVVVEPGKLSF